jgi:hypothetical protein
MTSALVARQVQKELRALALVFLATAVLVPLCALGFEPESMTLGLGIYVLGTSALGALSIGHEFTYDTLGQLLTQPGSRARLLMAKLFVLTSLLCLLAAAATVTIWPWAERGFAAGYGGFGDAYGDTARALRWTTVLIPALLAAFVAPLLTMLSRSVIAGTVFTIAVYAGLWLIVPGITWSPLPDMSVDARARDAELHGVVMLWLAAGLSAVSAIVGAVIFGRLESTGSRGIGTWGASRATTATQRGASRTPYPAVALLIKELRLQGIVFVIAALYVVAWAVVPLLGRESPERAYVFETVTVLYQVVLAMFIGAVASAEERALGTLQWQTLQPYAQWKQWTIKAATTLALSLLLVIVLPAALQAVEPHGGDMFVLAGLQLPSLSSQMIVRPQVWTLGAVVLALTAGALFTSSFNRSSLHALLLTPVSVPVIVLATSMSYRGSGIVVWKAFDLNTLFYKAARGSRVTRWEDSDFVWLERTYSLSVSIAVIGLLFLLLWFGLKNHRSAEAPRRMVARHVCAITAYCMVAAALIGGGYALEVWYLATH